MRILNTFELINVSKHSSGLAKCLFKEFVSQDVCVYICVHVMLTSEFFSSALLYLLLTVSEGFKGQLYLLPSCKIKNIIYAIIL